MTLVIIALAVAQVIRWFVFDNGPAQVFRRVRSRCGAHERVVKPGSLAEMFNCPWCMAVWASVPFSALYFIDESAALAVSFPLAVSFLAGAAVRLTAR